MEDIIAIVLVVGVFALIVFGVVKLHRFLMKKKHKDEAEMLAKKQAIEEFWDKKRADRLASMNKPIAKVQAVRAAAAPKKKETYNDVATPSVSSSSDDGFLTGMLVGAVLDNAFGHHSSGSSSVSKSDSWGLDDSDSRKSISDSMDTSSWSSSSSSDSWSSSDSGPSSDW